MSLSLIEGLRQRHELDLYVGDAQLQWADHRVQGQTTYSVQPLSDLQIAGVVQAVEKGLGVLGISRRVRINIILGLSWCRHVLLAWDHRLVDPALAIAVARVNFEKRFDSSAQGHHVILTKPEYLKSQVATFVSVELIESLRLLLENRGVQLGRAEPLLAVVWNRLPELPEGAGALAILEGGRVLVVRVQGGSPKSISTQPCVAPDDLLGTPLAESLYVFAPGQSVPRPLIALSIESGKQLDSFGYVRCAGTN
ncbi:hypothetical protein [Pseudomonas azotoformans]|uniref:Uncharacterized protein n=1 Tax=Pseudomonas azotoformans TaxID=47878 RepID=A0A127I189_PSEAZ|nr:hypothetical protein [Pseudomonas azotoformans]AMN80588.1 hypothetical protein AYR47_20760 [Pseudomonas azotoformans]